MARTYVGVEDVSMMTGEEVNAYDAFLVFLNGLIVGVHTKPTQLVEKGKPSFFSHLQRAFPLYLEFHLSYI